jgi:NAD-dependent deacetylase
MERRIPQLTLITQNVDGLLRQAGRQRVIELHGNISRTKCSQDGIEVESWDATKDLPPCCPRCGALLRPDVVWFGESLPVDALQAALEGALTCDLFFSVGTSSLVKPAASLPLEALRQGAAVVEVNPVSTPLTPYATYVVQAPAAHALPLILQATWPES